MESMPVVLPAPSLDDHAERVRNAKAIFSTNHGKLPSCEAEAGKVPMILRTDPTDDMAVLVANLRSRFPSDCKSLRLPIVNIYDYFDHHDVHLHGSGMMLSVLTQIGMENVTRMAQIERFCEDWKKANAVRFDRITQEGQDIFNVEEKVLYNAEFLVDASFHLKKMRLASPIPVDAVSLGRSLHRAKPSAC